MKQTDGLPENWVTKARRKLTELSIEHGRVLGEHSRLNDAIQEAAQERNHLLRELELQQQAVLYGRPNEAAIEQVKANLAAANDTLGHIRRMQEKYSHNPVGDVFHHAEKIAQLLRI